MLHLSNGAQISILKHFFSLIGKGKRLLGQFGLPSSFNSEAILWQTSSSCLA